MRAKSHTSGIEITYTGRKPYRTTAPGSRPCGCSGAKRMRQRGPEDSAVISRAKGAGALYSGICRRETASTTLMSMTLAEKIIARAAGETHVSPGQIVTCNVDLALMHDSSGPRRQEALLAELGVDVWDLDKIAIITDHFVSESSPDALAIAKLTRDWVEARDVKRFHEAQGICHVVLPQSGYLRPGMFSVGGDSHSTTAGAFGCLMVGIGATEMTGVLATGQIWIKTPATLRINISGQLTRAVAAKDIMLHLCAELGLMGANYKVVQYEGDAVSHMPMDERMVLSNMSAELGAKTALIAPDIRTWDFLARAGVEMDGDPARFHGDDDAIYENTLHLDAAALSPQVAAPHSPANSAPVQTHAGTPIDQAYIGACTGAKLEDLRMASKVLEGQRVAANTDLFVAPASVSGARQAEDEGTMQILRDAGAKLLPSACGACIGFGPAALGAGKVGISTSSRNFRGRMGHASSQTYLSSPFTAAASAIAGCITDPRDILRP